MRSAFLLLFTLVSFQGFSQKQEKGRLEVLDCHAFYAKMTGMLCNVLDVRSSAEFADGSIKGAKNLEWDSETFKDQAKLLPKNHPVFLFCQGGFRSGEAAQWFLKNGFTSVMVLENGFDAWLDASLPTTRKEVKTGAGSYSPED